jgi:tetratricopeptide (TPR) repeat protein
MSEADPSEADPRETAANLFRQAYELQVAAEFKDAIELYTRSIEAFPTAEAYTFRGWTYSFLGDYERAITDCLAAIQVDPAFGNPYNDIGAYLIEQGKWDEAIPWFEKAIAAERYEARCYPHFNLGRVYERRREWAKAKLCYAAAYSLDERYVSALAALRRLQAACN